MPSDLQVNPWNWDRHERMQRRNRGDEANFQDFVSARRDAGEGFVSREQALAAYEADPGHAHIDMTDGWGVYRWLSGVELAECQECRDRLAAAIGRGVPRSAV